MQILIGSVNRLLTQRMLLPRSAFQRRQQSTGLFFYHTLGLAHDKLMNSSAPQDTCSVVGGQSTQPIRTLCTQACKSSPPAYRIATRRVAPLCLLCCLCPAAMVLGGGPGVDLWPLTHTRAEVGNAGGAVIVNPGSHAGRKQLASPAAVKSIVLLNWEGSRLEGSRLDSRGVVGCRTAQCTHVRDPSCGNLRDWVMQQGA